MSVLLLIHVMYGCPQINKLIPSVTFLLACAIAGAPDVQAQAPESVTAEFEFRSDTALATAGYFQIYWNADEAVRLYESTTPGFEAPRIVYEGNDSGYTASGRRDGEIFFRLESAATGEMLGQPVRVEVAHHPLGRAFAFFLVGAIVFVATLLLIVTGSTSANRAAHTAAGNIE